LQKGEVLSLECKSERVMDDESGESTEPMPLKNGCVRIGEISAWLTREAGS